jgi:alkylation response protein AidB-like acyl-CoA dehydrogenase
VEFGPNDSERLFERILRDFLADRLPMEELHRLAASGSGFDDKLWAGLTELGLPGVLVPESFGGAGLGTFAAGLAAGALGASCAPVPFVAPAVIAPLALLRSGSDAARAAWLPRIAAGTARLAVAVDRPPGSTETRAIDRRRDRLSGRLDAVLDLAGATHVLAALADGTIAIVAVDDPGVRLSLGPSLDRTRPVGACVLNDSRAEILSSGADAGARPDGLVAAGRAMLAADTLGAAQTMLDRAVAYARQREQFGRPIGSFQAVKHACAEMAAMLEPARALVWYAAHAQDALPDDARVLACHAKAHLGEVGREVSRMATEVHGGMGFTHELGLHYWFKRLSANRQLLGGPERCRQEAAALQGWGAA